MCGIAVVIDSDRDRCEAVVRRMTKAQTHRGPDGEGCDVVAFGRGWVGLGHRRLSILDLSSSAGQPMTIPGGGPWLTYNGELYNYLDIRRELADCGHSFRSTGDTEVLLHALKEWGPAAFPKLRGMYAFAYFDPERRWLVVARDPAGIKPLYTARSGDRWAFASEVRPFLASGFARPNLDPQGVAGYLAYGAAQHPNTVFADVHSFPPGSYQEFEAVEAGGCRPVGPPMPFWTFPAPHSPQMVSPDEAVARVQLVVDSAVRDHLAADVSVGVFLSSGLDSTVVAGLAKRHAPDVHSYTVSFTEDADLDESAVAGDTARCFGLRHTVVPLTADGAERAAGEWLAALDMPSIDGLNTFVISQAVRRHGLKVCLSGQGGDELFGGYPSFVDVPRVRRVARAMGWMPVGLRRMMAGVVTRQKSASVQAKLGDMLAGLSDLASLALARRRLMSDAQLHRLGYRAADLGLDPRFLPPQAAAVGLDVGEDPVVIISRVESAYYQGNMLLRDCDANGMAHGLEIRLPLLGQQVLDLVHTLPGSVRLPAGGEPKHLLRQAFPDLLRPELLGRKKMGFTLPIRRWMQTSLRPLCEAGLGVLRGMRMFDRAGVDAVYGEFLAAPESPSWTRAFSLCVLGDYISRTAAVDP